MKNTQFRRGRVLGYTRGALTIEFIYLRIRKKEKLLSKGQSQDLLDRGGECTNLLKIILCTFQYG